MFSSKTLKKALLISLTILALFSCSIAFAQLQLPTEYKPDNAPFVAVSNAKGARGGSSFLNFFLQWIAGSLIYVAAPVAVIVIAIAGLYYVTSGAVPDNQKKAKEALKYAIIGLFVIIFSWIIVRGVIEQALNLNQSSDNSTATATAPVPPKPTVEQPETPRTVEAPTGKVTPNPAQTTP